MMKRIVAAILACGAGMLSASEAAAQSEPSWQGFYVGAQAAYHIGETIDSSSCVGLCDRDHQVREPYLALQAGYDARVGRNGVLGVFGWAGVTPVEDHAELAPGIVVRGETDFAGFLGVRAGIGAGRALPYAFVGYEHVTGTVRNDAAPIKKNDAEHNGFGVGVGAEYQLGRHFSVDARYMYSDLGEHTYDFGGGPSSYGEQAHTLSLAVNFRF